MRIETRNNFDHVSEVKQEEVKNLESPSLPKERSGITSDRDQFEEANNSNSALTAHAYGITEQPHLKENHDGLLERQMLKARVGENQTAFKSRKKEEEPSKKREPERKQAEFIAPESPRSERMETVNETRTLLEKIMGQKNASEIPPELAAIISRLDIAGSAENSDPVLSESRIRDLIRKVNDSQVSIDQIRRILEGLNEQLNNSQTSGEPVENQSMEFYLQVRDALEAAMRTRQADTQNDNK